MRYHEERPATQEQTLRRLAQIALAASKTQIVMEEAFAITRDCIARDGKCELKAVYDAVHRHVRYVADPRNIDRYVAPNRLLEMCARGACAGDCDDHAMLIAALTYAIGFRSGLRIYKPPNGDSFVHVYAIAGLPKDEPTEWVALDTTVDRYVGWEPGGNGAKYKTALLP